MRNTQFFFPPRKELGSDLTPVQKNILISSKSNNAKFLTELATRCLKSDFNVKDSLGNTPLYYAVKGLCVDAVEVLLRLGADVNAKNEFGNTSLHTAMLVKDENPKNERIINMLLNNGLTSANIQSDQSAEPYSRVKQNTANVRCLNNQNETPLFYASQKRKDDFGWKREVGMILSYD